MDRAFANLALAGGCEPIDEIGNFLTRIVILQPYEATYEAVALGTREELGYDAVAGKASGLRSRNTLEEEIDAHIENAGDLKEAAGPNPINALLVFLNLLEGEPQSLGKLLLAYAQHDPPGPNPAADVLVDGAG